MPDRQFPQLQMLWSERLLGTPPACALPAGYVLRGYRPDDEPAYLRLLELAGFEGWTAERLGEVLPRVLPGGLFLAVRLASGELAATAMALDNPTALHPGGGELGWVAAHPEHRGQGLGVAVCAAAVGCLLRAGYRRIYLLTDDFRLPAIKTYLRLGFVPFLFQEGMEQRWQEVLRQLGWPMEVLREGRL